MAEDSGWCTIESSPAVFTEILDEIGVRGVQVDEAYSYDLSELQRFSGTLGIIFLFHYRGNEGEHARARRGDVLSTDSTSSAGLFFANQTIQNACATQAMLSIVLNAPDVRDVGAELRQFREFTADMDPGMKGMVLSNSERIRTAHNAFAAQQSVSMIDEDISHDKKRDKDDAFHFVSYIPWKDGGVYELDGLQQGPRKLDVPSTDADCGNWLKVVSDDIADRVKEYAASEIRFGLLVVTKDQREELQTQLNQLKQQDQSNEVIRQQVEETEVALQQQIEKRKVWAAENARRKFNFIPFIFNFLRVLAETGHVGNVIEKATHNKKQAFQKALEHKRKEQAHKK